MSSTMNNSSMSLACSCAGPSTLPSKCLPPYTPSLPAPLYSDMPNTGERSLQYTPRVGASWFLPDSTYTKKLDNITITLFNQEENAQIPQYRQSGIISGSIDLKDAERVLEVSLLVEGRLDLSFTDTINNTTLKTIHSTTTLWKKPQNRRTSSTDSDSTPTKCLNQLVFAFSLPTDYRDASGTHPLPPSFQTLDCEASGVFARSSYRLRFTIKRTPKLGSGIALLEKTKHIFMPFEYKPRSRSIHPISSCTGSLALIKSLPDQWYQSTSTIEVPSLHGMNTTFEPVTANVFIPNPRVYALADSIPFHIQLSGRVDSLRALVAPDTLETPSFPGLSSRYPLPRGTCIKRLQGEMSTSLRVFLLRQIRLEIKGKVRVQNMIIGEAHLEAVPPAMTDCYCLPSGCKDEYLSWAGTLRVGEGVVGASTDVGGFHAGENLKVNDFVALSVGSSTPPWKDVRTSIGIRLVTEAWEYVNEESDPSGF